MVLNVRHACQMRHAKGGLKDQNWMKKMKRNSKVWSISVVKTDCSGHRRHRRHRPGPRSPARWLELDDKILPRGNYEIWMAKQDPEGKVGTLTLNMSGKGPAKRPNDQLSGGWGHFQGRPLCILKRSHQRLLSKEVNSWPLKVTFLTLIIIYLINAF